MEATWLLPGKGQIGIKTSTQLYLVQYILPNAAAQEGFENAQQKH